MRYILLTHRYLAVAIGFLMTLWCLSGFVMMYQAFPELDQEQRMQGLAPLNLQHCCNLSILAVEDDSSLPPFTVEMLLEDPILRLPSAVINLRTGLQVPALDGEQIMQVAETWADAYGLQADPVSRGTIDMDQWSVQAARRNRPVHHVVMNDRAGTEIYINGNTGAVFQKTTRRERILSWFGAIPHWLYPTLLRKNGPLWTEVVIWGAVAGTFLTATGLYVGIARIGRKRRTAEKSRISPYKGLWYWHHVLGLVFGVLTLTWVFSGLLTMNPWGALSGNSSYRQQIAGEATWGQLRRLLPALRAKWDQGGLPAGTSHLRSTVFGDELFVTTGGPEGTPSLRLNASAHPVAPLGEEDLQQRLQILQLPVHELITLEDEDAYYYAHKQPVEMPVLRAILADAEQTRIYVGPQSAKVGVLNETGRTSRWARTGLHRLDFPFMKARPVWDALMLLLLSGVTILCGTGTWMAYQRIKRDLRGISWSRR